MTFDRYRKNLSPTQGNHSWTSSSRSAKFFQAGKDGMGRQKRRRIEALGVWNSNCFQMSTWQREPWGKWSFVLPKSNETLVLGLMLKPHKISSSLWVSASRISVQSRALPLETGRSIYLGCHLLAFQVPQCMAWGWSTKGKAIQLRKYQRILDKWLTNAENINIKKKIVTPFFSCRLGQSSERICNWQPRRREGVAQRRHLSRPPWSVRPRRIRCLFQRRVSELETMRGTDQLASIGTAIWNRNLLMYWGPIWHGGEFWSTDTAEKTEIKFQVKRCFEISVEP